MLKCFISVRQPVGAVVLLECFFHEIPLRVFSLLLVPVAFSSEEIWELWNSVDKVRAKVTTSLE